MNAQGSLLQAIGEEARAAIEAKLSGESRRSKFLVGVSGGADSVFLLHVLKALGFSKLIVCHLNHGLRGRQSSTDATFVKRLAASMGYECRIGRAQIIRQPGVASIEAAGRSARHRFFAQVARDTRCRRLFLGHQANDRAETILFNLLRGTGLGGLTAMPPSAVLAMDGLSIRVVRPLLQLRADTIRKALQTAMLPWREDATNSSSQFTRNRIRHEAIPLLEQIMQRDVVAALLRTADIVEADHALLDELASAIPSPTPLPVAVLQAQPVSLQRRTIKRWLDTNGVAGAGFEEIESIRRLLAPQVHAGRRVNLPHSKAVRLHRKLLYVEQQLRT